MFLKQGAVEWNVHLALEYAKHGLTLAPRLGYWNVREVGGGLLPGASHHWEAYREWGSEHSETVSGPTLESIKKEMLEIEQAIWEGKYEFLEV